jgi:hypothetical protein
MAATGDIDLQLYADKLGIKLQTWIAVLLSAAGEYVLAEKLIKSAVLTGNQQAYLVSFGNEFILNELSITRSLLPPEYRDFAHDDEAVYWFRQGRFLDWAKCTSPLSVENVLAHTPKGGIKTLVVDTHDTSDLPDSGLLRIIDAVKACSWLQSLEFWGRHDKDRVRELLGDRAHILDAPPPHSTPE